LNCPVGRCRKSACPVRCFLQVRKEYREAVAERDATLRAMNRVQDLITHPERTKPDTTPDQLYDCNRSTRAFAQQLPAGNRLSALRDFIFKFAENRDGHVLFTAALFFPYPSGNRKIAEAPRILHIEWRKIARGRLRPRVREKNHGRGISGSVVRKDSKHD
jgi:hypothetical protein